MVRAKKSLGQHFLKDRQVAERIAATLSAYASLPVLEVGAGTGMLTQFLLAEGYALTAVEVDGESVAYLERHFPGLPILAEDFLQMDLGSRFAGSFCVIGNYPYHISSQIFFKVLDWKDRIPCCAGMIQREVAERLASKAGRKAYGIISVLVQTWYDVEYLFTVGPEVFTPPPKVQSAVIRMTRNERTALDCPAALYRTVVRTAFNRRRKTLRNSLQPLLGKDCPAYAQPLFDKRPEQLTVEQFMELTRIADAHLQKTQTGVA